MFVMYVMAFVTVVVSLLSYNQSRSVSQKLEKNSNTIKNLQQQTFQWMSRYEKEKKEHQETIQMFINRFEKMETRMKNLEYIVDKMDGREIVRDENFNIKKVVKLSKVRDIS